jgi:hypothetical protein
MFWIFPILSVKADPFALTRLNLLSQEGPSAPQFSFDRVITQFNSFLRRTHHHVKIRDQVSLEAKLFSSRDDSERRFIAHRLLDSLDRSNPLCFIEQLSLMVNSVPERILERSKGITAGDLAIWLGVLSSAYSFVPVIRTVMGI